MASGYTSSISTVSGAAEGFGLTIDTETFERWKRVGAAAGLLDDLLDESSDPIAARKMYEYGLDNTSTLFEVSPTPGQVDPRLIPAVTLLANSVVELPNEKLERLRKAARAIGSYAISKAQCTDVHEYIDLLRQEAKQTSVLIHGSASDTVMKQPEFKAFALWADHAMEFGTFADSARDLWTDHKQGRTRVRPTPRNSTRIAAQAVGAARKLVYPVHNLTATRAALKARLRFYL